jgi:hypothetical protein
MVYIAFDGDCSRGGPYPPLYSLGDMFTLKFWSDTNPEILPEYFSDNFLPCPTSFTSVRVVLLHYE